MIRIFKNPSYDFLGNRKIAYSISVGLLIIGIIFVIMHGGLRKSIDFAGGVMLELHFTKQIPTADIRSALKEAGITDAEIQVFKKTGDVLIRAGVKKDKDIAKIIKEKLRNKFSNALPKNRENWLRSEEHVSPKIGKELTVDAVWAILASLSLIILYIWWRFRFTFGIAAVVALFHDVLITIAFFAMTNREVSLQFVAALLTIVGYSLNDTIVVFDRIREGMKLYYNKDYKYVLNASINSTLGRTILTSFTTFLVVLTLFLFGGEAIHNFSFALMIGVIVGTYSSIFVASALLYDWQVHILKKKQTAK